MLKNYLNKKKKPKKTPPTTVRRLILLFLFPQEGQVVGSQGVNEEHHGSDGDAAVAEKPAVDGLQRDAHLVGYALTVCAFQHLFNSQAGQVCTLVSRSTYLTLRVHLTSPSSTRLLYSAHPHHSCITVYTDTTYTHMYYTYFTVYIPLHNIPITLCTHMTPNSKCVPTQHPLHSVYPHNIDLQSTYSFQWEDQGSQAIRADDAHPFYPDGVDRTPRQ